MFTIELALALSILLLEGAGNLLQSRQRRRGVLGLNKKAYAQG